ncbi:MAG: metal-dependent hydrolase [Clostridiales bacterium]|nr:metal-dependent hydrolase [Clostridiales bacterium]
MMGKTHVMMGTASALVFTAPVGMAPFCAAMMGGAIGGIICDVDVKGGGRLGDALMAKVMATGIAGASLLFDHFTGGSMMAAMGPIHSLPFLLGAAGFVVLCILGGVSDHRGFTHSLFAMGLFSLCVHLFCRPALWPFVAGYLSHLVLDLLNKRPLKLFFPFPNGVCLKLFYSNKLADQVLLGLGVIGTAVGIFKALI